MAKKQTGKKPGQKKKAAAKKRQANVPAPYSEQYREKKLRKEVGVSGLFLCLLCAVAIAVFSVRAIARTGFGEILNLAFAAFFLTILVAYVVFPARLFAALDRLKPVTDTVGKYVLRALLLPLYLLTCLLSLLFAPKQRGRYRFLSWAQPPADKDTYLEADAANVSGEGSSGTLRFLSSLLGVFSEKGQFFLFPVLIALLLLGLFFFFISSSSVLGFLYTLF